MRLDLGNEVEKLRFVETSPWVDKLHEGLMAIFQTDKNVQIVGVSEDFPL